MNRLQTLAALLGAATILVTGSAFTAASASEQRQLEPAATEACAADLRYTRRRPAIARTCVVAPATVVRRVVSPRPPVPVQVARVQVSRPVPRIVVTMVMLGVGF